MKTDLFLELVKSYFTTSNTFFTKHHLDSYNDFVDRKIPQVINSLNPFELVKFDAKDNKTEKHRIQIFVGGEDGRALYFDHPTITQGGETRLMFPNDARLHDLTYAVNLFADIVIYHSNRKVRHETPTLLQKVKIGRIPIMLHSKLCILNGQTPSMLREVGECPYDQGGYFIVDGKEKFISTLEENANNMLFVYKIDKHKQDKFSFKGQIRCTSAKDVFPKTTRFFVFSKYYRNALRKDAIVVTIPELNMEVPLFVLFRCLGVESDMDILKCIIGHELDSDMARLFIDFLYASIVDGNIVFNKKQALRYLQSATPFNTEANVEFILRKNFLINVEYELQRFDKNNERGIDTSTPYMGSDSEFVVNKAKAMYLGFLVNKLVRVCLNIAPDSDRDNYITRRLAISGFLIGEIFKDFYNIFRNECLNRLNSTYEKGDLGARDILTRTITETTKHEYFKPDAVTTGFTNSIKGLWGKDKRTGIVQDVNRISYISYVSNMRVVDSQMDPGLKLKRPHQLNSSQYGILCPVESPEGQKIGLTKHMALMCHITFETNSRNVLEAVTRYFKVTFLENLLYGSSFSANMVRLLINNTWIGVIDDADAPTLVRFIRLLRRNALINIFTSVSWNVFDRTINILTEGKRPCRPLLIVDEETQEIELFKPKHRALIRQMFEKKIGQWYVFAKGYTRPTELFNMYDDAFHDPADIATFTKLTELNDIIKKLDENAAPLEFLDIEEVNTRMIAMMPEDLNKKPKHGDFAYYSHLEIHPTLMFSAYASTITLSNHSQAPRNIFSFAQAKQAISVYATNFRSRIDTQTYILHYGQKRLTATRYYDYLKYNELPNGENLIVAISTHNGMNVEDSLILNKTSIQRGCFNITSYKNYYSTEDYNAKTGERIFFANPHFEKEKGMDINVDKYADYTTLDENGFPKVNSDLYEGRVIVGRIKEQPEGAGEKDLNLDNVFHEKKDGKKTYINMVDVAKKTVSGKVDKVYVKQNYTEGTRNCKIRIRKFKMPEVGDKAANFSAQKGVFGMILPAEDMPFTRDGIVPDAIINPHGLPSRMTLNMLLEMVMNKVGVCEGHLNDGTPFERTDFNYFYDQLEKNGYERYANEVLYDPRSGQQMPTDIVISPSYYFRLKHQVGEKINYRARGKNVSLTMQPTGGRAKSGGLKIGEMEKDTLTAHGVSGFLKESMMDRSDKHTFYVKDETGEILGINPSKDIYHGVKKYSKVEMPYAFKLASQELQAMSVNMRLRINDRLEIDSEAMETHYDDYVKEPEDLDDFDQKMEDELIAEN